MLEGDLQFFSMLEDMRNEDDGRIFKNSLLHWRGPSSSIRPTWADHMPESTGFRRCAHLHTDGPTATLNPGPDTSPHGMGWDHNVVGGNGEKTREPRQFLTLAFGVVVVVVVVEVHGMSHWRGWANGPEHNKDV